MGNAMWARGAGDKAHSNYHDSEPKAEDDTLVVVNDYPSPDISEPIFRMGERLRVLSRLILRKIRDAKTPSQSQREKPEVQELRTDNRELGPGRGYGTGEGLRNWRGATELERGYGTGEGPRNWRGATELERGHGTGEGPRNRRGATEPERGHGTGEGPRNRRGATEPERGYGTGEGNYRNDTIAASLNMENYYNVTFGSVTLPLLSVCVCREGNWWRVQAGPSGNENYIPNDHVAKVYHGWLFEGVARHKAEELLHLPGNRLGSFMVRESAHERGVYSLSVKHRTITHYKIFRLENSWFYISPRLTFQCLEDMVNHYSDSSDGLCCILTAPCLSGTTNALDLTSQPPPVVMRRNNFDWKKVDRKDLISTAALQGQNNTAVSYGVRNSMASYLSLTGTLDPVEEKKKSRKKKSKSVYAMPNHSLSNVDLDEDYGM